MAEQDKQADVSKHTPGLMALERINADELWIVNKQNKIASIIYPLSEREEMEANAERLIKCWNSHEPGGSHDALVEACEYERKRLTLGIGQATHALALIEAALELAKKGA